MRLSIAAVAATCVAALASCQFSGNKVNDHWNFDSVAPRVIRTMTGFDPSVEGTYKDFAHERKQSIGLTLRRHMLNHNPMNPNQATDESMFAPRPPHSILPNPWRYVHFEGILLGWAMTGVPVPIPVDSIIGTLEPGGLDEFKAGVANAFDEKGVITSADARTLYGEDGTLPPFEMTKGK